MDPASIVGLILSVGQCMQPLIACLRTISDYRQIDRTIAGALKKTILYCERLELSLGDMKLIDESSITAGHKTFLRRTLDEFRAAVLSHRAEVDSWILRLGLPNEPAFRDPQLESQPLERTREKMPVVTVGEESPRRCFGKEKYISRHAS